MRLIDADTLIESMGLENAVKYGNKDGYQQDHSYSTLMRYEIKREIDCQPTVDAVPVVHGRWGKTSNPSYSPFDGSSEHLSICSNCAYLRGQHDFLYCPNCGARMDGEADDNG